MDELEEDQTGENIDVAALMGFGSFGDQHRGKRRRYNSRTDGAVVDGDASTSATGKGKGKAIGKKGSGSGSNNLPLGTPRPRPNKGGLVETEGNEESGNDTPQNATRNERGEQNEDAVRETDGNVLAPDSPTHAAPPRDSHAPPSTDKLAPTPTPTPTQLPRPTSRADTSLPPKPPLPSPTTSGTGTRKGTGTGAENEAWKLRKGVRLANGDVAYYDASFVEDPWRGLR